LKLKVPYYSQLKDVKDETWQKKACGIVALKMLLEYGVGEKLDADELIKEGIAINGYLESVGWKHDGLVELADRHGLILIRKEYKNNNLRAHLAVEPPSGQLLGAALDNGGSFEDSVADFKNLLQAGHPCLVSIATDFNDKSTFHLVLLAGFEANPAPLVGRDAQGKDGGALVGFYYHDPNAESQETGAYKYITIEDFKKYWRRLAIVVKV